LGRNNGKDLDASLEAYSAAVDIAAPSGSRSDRLGSWPIYAAAAGSALALSTSAAAGIIYSGIQNFTVSVTASAPGYRFNSDYFTAGNFSAYPYLQAFHINAAPTIRIGGVGIAPYSCGCSTQFFGGPYNGLVSNFPLKNLSFGRTIGTGLSNATTQLRSAGYLAFKCQGSDLYPCYGGSDLDLQPWGPSNVTGFAGFRTPSGNFGWVRLLWSSSAGFPNSITAIDWAVEDSGAPIRAGQTISSVPEPGTMSMSLLAAGAAGILAWRKRKAIAAKSQA
jgi:hypothetical protein